MESEDNTCQRCGAGLPPEGCECLYCGSAIQSRVVAANRRGVDRWSALWSKVLLLRTMPKPSVIGLLTTVVWWCCVVCTCGLAALLWKRPGFNAQEYQQLKSDADFMIRAIARWEPSGANELANVQVVLDEIDREVNQAKRRNVMVLVSVAAVWVLLAAVQSITS